MPKKKIKKQGKRKSVPWMIYMLFLSCFWVLLSAVYLYNIKFANDFCANSISCLNDLSGQKEADNAGVFEGRQVQAPNLPEKPLYSLQDTRNVLGDSTGDYKHIYIDLTHQRLLAYEGNNLVYEFLISSGKWNPTPTGDFRIWIWLRYTRMAGGSRALGTYYNLPNVPYTMYFWNSSTPKTWGYSLHGTYWHNNFGHPMSHGCVNMKTEEAEKIYYWTNPNANSVAYASSTNPGTLITIYGTAPRE